MATLAFAKHVNKALKGSGQTSPRPLFILHGLFGSKRNWMTLSNKLADRLQTTVYAVDLPNHGESPWTQVAVSYSTMSADVSRLIQHVLEESGVSQFDLIGHSMGAKVAMTLALSSSVKERLHKLIAVDMAPGKARLSSEFESYILRMKQIEDGGIGSRVKADEMLKDVVKDAETRRFLLTNLVRAEDRHPTAFKHVPGPLAFGVNLEILLQTLPNLAEFVSHDSVQKSLVPALFIYGTRSDYVKPHQLPLIQSYFPNAQLEALDAGHWAHHERQTEFLDAAARFLKDQ